MTDHLRKLGTDFLAFADAIAIPSGHGPARFGDVMAEFQRERFRDLAPDLHAIQRHSKPPARQHFWEASKGASKDSDLAVALLWLLAFSRRSLRCQVGAADQDQADELRRAARDILQLNPWLAKFVSIQRNRIVCDRTEAECEIIAADVAGSHGARPDVLIVNELSHVTKQEFAQNLMDNATKVPHGLVVIATNAGQVGTWQHEWRENARTSDRWKFHRLAEPAPWIDAEAIDEARRRNPAARFRRLWYSEWTTGDGDAIDSHDIDAAWTLPGPTLQPERGWLYIGGLDMGIRRDHTALAIAGLHVGYSIRKPRPQPPRSRHQEILADLNLLADAPPEIDSIDEDVITIPGSGRIKLCRLSLWQPGQLTKVDVESIESTALALHHAFRLRCLAYDPHQAEYLAERLQKRGVPTLSIDQTGPTLRGMASAVHEAFTDRMIDLYPHEELQADLQQVRLVEKSYGWRLWSPTSNSGGGTRHGDSVTSLAIALLVAKRFQGYSGDFAENAARELTCWP